jgi:vitamin B12 transport system substrate-binding protein
MPRQRLFLTGAFALALAAAGPAASAAERIVSLNPSLTEMLVALGARERIVGIDDRSAQQDARLAHLPRVGGLFNPSLEGVVALAPDVVVVFPRAPPRYRRELRLARGIAVRELPNIPLDELRASI